MSTLGAVRLCRQAVRDGAPGNHGVRRAADLRGKGIIRVPLYMS